MTSTPTATGAHALYRIYLWNGIGTKMKEAESFDEAVEVIVENIGGQIPKADHATIVFKDRRLGRLTVFDEDDNRNLITTESVHQQLNAMEALWDSAPKSRRRGGRPAPRRAKLHAILAEELTPDVFAEGAHGARITQLIEERVWDLLK